MVRLSAILCFLAIIALRASDAYVITRTGTWRGVITHDSKPMSKVYFERRPLRLNAVAQAKIKGSSSASKISQELKIEKSEEVEGENMIFWKSMCLLLAFTWATNFPIIKVMYDAAPELDASLYSALRFGLAGAVFLPFVSSLQKMETEDAKDLTFKSFMIGFVLFIGYLGQAQGLIDSTAGKGAFICTLQIVLVALWRGWEKQNFSVKTWVSVALALLGTGLLELQGSQAPQWGDLWLLLQPVGFGAGYVLLEDVVRKYPDEAKSITAIQLASLGLLCALWAGFEGHTMQEVQNVISQPVALQILTYTGLVTTAGTILLQSAAFKRVSAADASIIIASEPVWASIVAFLAMGETMNGVDISGAALILLAGLSNELDFVGKMKNLLSSDKTV